MKILIVFISFLFILSCTDQNNQENKSLVQTDNNSISNKNEPPKEKKDEDKEKPILPILIKDSTAADSAGIKLLSIEMCKKIADTIARTNPINDFMLSFIEKDDYEPPWGFQVFYNNFSSPQYKEYMVNCVVACSYKGPAGLLFLTKWNEQKKAWQIDTCMQIGLLSISIEDLIKGNGVVEISTIDGDMKGGVCRQSYKIFNLKNNKPTMFYRNITHDFDYNCGEGFDTKNVGDTLATVIEKIEVRNGFVLEHVTHTIHNGVPGINNDSIDAYRDHEKIIKNAKKSTEIKKVKLKEQEWTNLWYD